jgi:hypothetical protein
MNWSDYLYNFYLIESKFTCLIKIHILYINVEIRKLWKSKLRCFAEYYQALFISELVPNHPYASLIISDFQVQTLTSEYYQALFISELVPNRPYASLIISDFQVQTLRVSFFEPGPFELFTSLDNFRIELVLDLD